MSGDLHPENENADASLPIIKAVYAQLKEIAQSRLNNERPGHSLAATALVHEAWIKLQHRDSVMRLDRDRFLVAAAEAMRRILVDHARNRGRLKRGGDDARRATIDLGNVADLAAEYDSDQILALEESICRLQQEDPNAARVVELRFFAGLSVEETARAMGMSERSVGREWKYARAWLMRALSD